MSEAAQAAAPASADTGAAAAAATPAPVSPSPAPAGAGAGAAPASPTPAPAPDTSGAAPAGTDLNGSGQDGGIPQNDWTAPLDQDNRTLIEQKGWKDINTALKSYRELQTKLGEKTFAPPAEDAGQDEWNAFYAKMGRPEAPDAYRFTMPEGVPENLPYDANFAMKFKNWAHEQGLSPRQADALHGQYVKEMAGSISQQAEQRATQIETAHKDIVKAWGDPGTDDYRRNQEMARRALIQSGAKDAFIEAGIIDAQSGMITSAPVAKFLAQVGTKMFAEDSMFSGPASYGKNPFTEKEFNMTEQSMLIKNDPGKAAILIRAAGQKPSDYGMADN